MRIAGLTREAHPAHEKKSILPVVLLPVSMQKVIVKKKKIHEVRMLKSPRYF